MKRWNFSLQDIVRALPINLNTITKYKNTNTSINKSTNTRTNKIQILIGLCIRGWNFSVQEIIRALASGHQCNIENTFENQLVRKITKNGELKEAPSKKDVHSRNLAKKCFNLSPRIAKCHRYGGYIRVKKIGRLG